MKTIVAIRALELRKQLDLHRGARQLTFRFATFCTGRPRLRIESNRGKPGSSGKDGVPVVSLATFPERCESFAFAASGRLLPLLSPFVEQFVPGDPRAHRALDASDVILLDLHVRKMRRDRPGARRRQATLYIRTTSDFSVAVRMRGWFSLWIPESCPWSAPADMEPCRCHHGGKIPEIPIGEDDGEEEDGEEEDGEEDPEGGLEGDIGQEDLVDGEGDGDEDPPGEDEEPETITEPVGTEGDPEGDPGEDPGEEEP